MASHRVLAWIDRRFGALALWLLARPARGFAWLVALHLLLWWLVSVLSQLNLPLDVMEIFAWSQNPGWATHKQAPQVVWLFWLFDHAGFGWQPIVQLQAPLAWCVMAWAVWRLALQLTTPGRALFVNALLPNSPWVDLQQLRRDGALVVWRVSDQENAGAAPPDWLAVLVRREKQPAPLLGPSVALPWRLWGKGPAPMVVRFAVLPPTRP